MTETTYDANQVLMGGGDGVPAAKFANPGDSIRGRIAAPPIARQEREYDKENPGGGALKTFPSGDPIMGVLVDIATSLRDPSIEDDDGTRRLYVEGRYLKEAIRNAVRAAGSPGLEVGGVIELTFTHREDPEDKRSRKYWKAVYTPAGNAALMATPAAAPASAPVVQAAPPVAAPAPAVAAPAPAPAAAPSAGDMAKQLIAVGLDDAQIAATTGLDPMVIGALRAAA